jgi:seryl-tRNA synthetase
MHDIKLIRDNPQTFDEAMKRRGFNDSQSAAILALDTERRSLQTELQDLQAARNEKSKSIGKIKSEGGDAQAVMDEVSAMKTRMGELEELEGAKADALNQHLAGLPNIMADDVPDGADEDQNVEIHTWGDIKFEAGPDHVEIGENLGMMDFETAAKMSGARFTLLTGPLARMERALAQFFLDTHTGEHGYTETSPPL